jgi:hypothetical protein
MKPMIDPEIEFKEELRMFGNEVEEAMQCFYAEQGWRPFSTGRSWTITF